MALPKIARRQPQMSTQFTGQEAINFATNDEGKLPMMDIPEPAAPPGDMGDILSTASKAVGSISSALMPQTEVNEKFMSRNQNIEKQIAGATQTSDAVQGVVSKLGPWGAAVGAAMGVGTALSKSATDEFGVVKDSGKAIIGGILNPIEGISTLIGQKERRESKERFVNTEIQSKKAENQVAGNKITNSIPKYTPPSYGRFGRKLTKFTR